MSDRWMIRTNAYGNCNCSTNCGCQFNLPSTHGFCQFVEGGHIEEGYFNDTSLNGLNWAFIIIWPGEIAEGNGKQLVIIDERADSDQHEALAELGQGTATVTDPMAMDLDSTYAQFCTLHYDQDGLVKAA